MESFFASAWDGNHVFIQWLGVDGAGIRVRYKPKGATDWRAWLEVGTPWPIAGRRFVLPTHQQGGLIQVMVGEPTGKWVIAKVREICRVKATFQFDSQVHTVLRGGSPIAGLVRSEMAAFLLPGDLELEPGVPKVIDMTSAQTSPFNELDAPSEFRVSPMQGVVVENVTPTGSCLVPRQTFRGPRFVGDEHEAEIAALSPDGLFAIHLGVPLPMQ